MVQRASMSKTDVEKARGAAANKPAHGYLQIFYIALNVFAACSIVFANKIVFGVCRFKFVTTLTIIHTVFTWAGMLILCRCGFFDAKRFGALQVAPLALGYVGYVVLNNLSLNLNTVGLYQILKITIAPTVIALEFFMFGKVQSNSVLAAVSVVCIGVTFAAVTDPVAVSNLVGLAVGLASVLATALYQIWAGSKQKELQANSSQLLLAYTPQAIGILMMMAPIMDDIGVTNPTPDTVLGFSYTPGAVTAIVISGLLGVLVSLSTFLVIGATSSLTYNVVGHFKTILILAGGCLFFGDTMPGKRFLGILVTMFGIAWYTTLTMQQPAPAESSSVSAASKDTGPRIRGGQESERRDSAGGVRDNDGTTAEERVLRDSDLEREPLLVRGA